MKLKRLLSILAILCVIIFFVNSQEKILKFFGNNGILATYPIAEIDSIKVGVTEANEKSLKIHRGNEFSELSVANIDSVKIEDVSLTLAKEREALIAIYNALDGDNWTNNENWCSDKPVSEWYGVYTDENGFVIQLELYESNGQIPNELFVLTYLKVLCISNYSGNTYSTRPTDINKLSNLEKLQLSGHYKGTLPTSIGDCLNLSHLTISDSKIRGSIPTELGKLVNLKYLDFSFNSLSGELPESLGNLLQLENIMLRNNQLTGNIPQTIQKLPIWKYDWGRIISENSFNTKTMVIPAPTIKGTTIDDKSVCFPKQNTYSVLIQWSAQYDNYLVSNIENLNEIYSKYKDKVSFMGLVSSSSEVCISSVEEYIQDNNILWPNIYWDYNSEVIVGQTNSCDGTSRHEYAAPCFPSIFVFYNDKVTYWDLNVYGGVSGLDDYLSINVLGETPDYYISTDFSQDGAVTTLQTASVGDGIDIVLMGDAYSDRQIADGTYAKDMEYIYNNLFTEEPYKSFKDHFNVHYVNVVSATEGYEYGNTALDGYFGEGTFVGGNNNTVFTYAQKAINDERMDEAMIVVAMNSNNYAGTCYMYYPEDNAGYGNGVSVSYFPKGGDETTFAQLLHHEACGHGFAKLADEYAYEDMGAVPEATVTEYKATQSNWGWWKNVDFTSDTSAIRWNYFINDSRYANEGLGAFEGGLTYWNGVWRPTENSIMRHNTGGFNAPSREAIYYRIHKLAYGDDWQYNYEDFVEWDAKNRTAVTTASRVKAKKPANYKPTHPPVIVNKSWRDTK